MITIATEAKEGSSEIEVDEGVFYNPKMKCLRDISVAFLNAFGEKGDSLIDCTSATGIRGIRYSKEAGISDLTFLDTNEKAAENTAKNLKKNKINAVSLNIDLEKFASESVRKFSIIDLDPFGSPAPYIRDILKLSEDGTIVMLTATDTAVLCGAHAKACVKQYAAAPMHNHLCKEAGIRILISHFIRKASEFNFGTELMISISDMHYMRLFLRLRKGAQKAYDSMMQNGFGAYCHSCSSFAYMPGIAPTIGSICHVCGSKMKLFGPIFLGKLADKALAGKMLKETDESGCAYKTINAICVELDTPFFYHLPTLTRKLKTSSVPFHKISEVLEEKGFICTRTAFNESGIKTDAPLEEILSAISKVKELQ